MSRYVVNEAYDPDLQRALEQGGEKALRVALAAMCACGHTREHHHAMTGSLGSFGGSACGQCWTCPTFTAT